MGKTKLFKCPKCGTLLTFKIELPPNNTKWPIIFPYPHTTADGSECNISIGIDPNYDIREVQT